jgi:hypothetical protein
MAKTSKKALKKPKKVNVSEPVYKYDEMVNYLQKKTGRDLRNWAGKTYGTGEASDHFRYLDFWHWLCESELIVNSSFTYIPIDFYGDKGPEDPEDKWIYDILMLFKEEFGEPNNLKCWVEW